MKKGLDMKGVLALALLLLLPSVALAQNLRADKTLFLKPRVGLSNYMGDNERSPFNFNGDAFDEGFPYALGAELGYQLNPKWSLGLGFEYGDYPVITQFVNGMDLSAHNTTRPFFQLIARYLFNDNKVAPYLQGGLHYGKTDVQVFKGTLAGEQINQYYYGPLLGIGLDIALNEKTSFNIEWNTNFTFGDDAADGFIGDNVKSALDGSGFNYAAIGVDSDGGGPADLLSSLTVGLTFRFKGAYTPVDVMRLEGPARLALGEEGVFTGTVNADVATQPITYALDFGDGMVAGEMSGTHTYNRVGTYTVTLRATNRVNTDSESITVEVYDPIVPAQIITMTASTMSPDTQTAVQFNATARGTEPLTYSWDFGDGSTSSQQNPTHTYTQPGTYTVTLTVSNSGGSDSRTLTVTVSPYEPPYCATLSEMNSVYFDRNSSTLTAEARAQLMENVQIFQDCTNLNARIEGWAAPGERNAQRLSEDRARAVEQFYIDNGIAASRLRTQGLGRMQGVTSKKEGSSGFRRVDTIPVR